MPGTLALRRACRKLAAIEERLESTKEGTPEHQRLVQRSIELTNMLQASRSSRSAEIDAITDDMSDAELIARAIAILRELLI